jgi:hypothetical protein
MEGLQGLVVGSMTGPEDVPLLILEPRECVPFPGKGDCKCKQGEGRIPTIFMTRKQECQSRKDLKMLCMSVVIWNSSTRKAIQQLQLLSLYKNISVAIC